MADTLPGVLQGWRGRLPGMKRILPVLALVAGFLPLTACDAVDSAACDVSAKAAADVVKGMIENQLGTTFTAEPEYTCDGGGVSLLFDRGDVPEATIRAKLVEMECTVVDDETYNCSTAGQVYDVAVFGDKWLQVVLKNV